MEITVNTLVKITGRNASDNMRSVIEGLRRFGKSAGLSAPHCLAHYLAQLCHESGAFRYDREVWGPTKAQLGYEGRKDLGNTQPGDGKKFMGRTGIQNTGRGNATRFRDWCRDQGFAPPDFAENPDAMNTDPWEGLSPIWYWTVGNPTGKSLNRLADKNDIEMITRRVNGGLNGYADRLAWFTKCALVIAGYSRDAVRQFQADAKAKGHYKGAVDGIDGPQTRAALHLTLVAMSEVSQPDAAPSPVVEEVAVVEPVVVQGAEKTGLNRLAGLAAILSPLVAGFGQAFGNFDQRGVLILTAVGIVGAGVLLWHGEKIASRAKAVLKAFE
jgi:putative chitinase